MTPTTTLVAVVADALVIVARRVAVYGLDADAIADRARDADQGVLDERGRGVLERLLGALGGGG